MVPVGPAPAPPLKGQQLVELQGTQDGETEGERDTDPGSKETGGERQTESGRGG